MSGSIGRRNTGVKISLLGFQIARSHVVVRLADEPLCSDRFASAPTSRCPSESTVAAGHWCSRSTRAATGFADRKNIPPGSKALVVVSASFPLRLQLKPFQRKPYHVGACLNRMNSPIQFYGDDFGADARLCHPSKEGILLRCPPAAAAFDHVRLFPPSPSALDVRAAPNIVQPL